MDIDEGAIAGVSDTALWIAAVRARESRRPDAVFQDPLAGFLAGTRGPAIARAMPRPAMVHWAVVARTCAIDRLIAHVVAEGADLVVNLGAGLDTRPYRMNLPAHLTWVEVDLPALIEGKDRLLSGHVACCQLERVALDLSDRAARRRFLDACGLRSTNALVLTEGVLPYFSNEAVAALARDLRDSLFRFWIQDFDNAGRRTLPRGWAGKLAAAPFLFEPDDWFGFFRAEGWAPLDTISTLDQAEHLGRPYPLDFPHGLLARLVPKEMRRRILRLSGAVLLRNAGTAT